MKTYKRIEAVRKAGEILKFLANEKEPVSGQEIARAVNIPAGTVMCHMITLEELGFVVSVGERFNLGMALALMWARVKSTLEGEKERVEKDLNSLENNNV